MRLANTAVFRLDPLILSLVLQRSSLSDYVTIQILAESDAAVLSMDASAFSGFVYDGETSDGIFSSLSKRCPSFQLLVARHLPSLPSSRFSLILVFLCVAVLLAHVQTFNL